MILHSKLVAILFVQVYGLWDAVLGCVKMTHQPFDSATLDHLSPLLEVCCRSCVVRALDRNLSLICFLWCSYRYRHPIALSRMLRSPFGRIHLVRVLVRCTIPLRCCPCWLRSRRACRSACQDGTLATTSRYVCCDVRGSRSSPSRFETGVRCRRVRASTACR